MELVVAGSRFQVATFGGSLFSGGGGGRYFRDLLTLVKFYRYFRRIASFGGSLFSGVGGGAGVTFGSANTCESLSLLSEDH